jgi:hypothetical protein
VDSVVETRRLITWVVFLAVELCDMKRRFVHCILELLLPGERNDYIFYLEFQLLGCRFYIARFVGVSIRTHIILFRWTYYTHLSMQSLNQKKKEEEGSEILLKSLASAVQPLS